MIDIYGLATKLLFNITSCDSGDGKWIKMAQDHAQWTCRFGYQVVSCNSGYSPVFSTMYNIIFES